MSSAAGPIAMNVLLRRPPLFALITSLTAITVGTVVGAVLDLFQDAIYAAARRDIIRRPELHGFSGSEVIDQGRIAEVADQANTALRLLHTHSIGIGMIILVAALVIANLPIRAVLGHQVLISLGVFYPLGWAALTWLFAIMGIDALRNPVEWIFFVPFAMLRGPVGNCRILFHWMAAVAAGRIGIAGKMTLHLGSQRGYFAPRTVAATFFTVFSIACGNLS